MSKSISYIALLFFGGMTALTFTSREIHKKRIPHVEVITVSNQDFVCKFLDDEGNKLSTIRRAIGIPKYLNCENLYVIIEETVYGEKRSFAQKIEVLKNDTYDSAEYDAIISGLQAGDKLITSDNRFTFVETNPEVYYERK